MYLMSFDMDGCERSCRAEVFTCTTSDTPFFKDSRDHRRLRVVRVLAYHTYCAIRTVTCAVSAAYTVSVDYAVVKIHHSMADLY